MQIIMPGQPKAKGRPRFGKGNAYTPETTRAAEQALGWTAKQLMVGRELLEGPLQVTIHAWIKTPKRSKLIHAITKPDADNLAKLVCDALNGIVWHDDRQIVDLRVTKNYSAEPRTVINIEPIPTREHQHRRAA